MACLRSVIVRTFCPFVCRKVSVTLPSTGRSMPFTSIHLIIDISVTRPPVASRKAGEKAQSARCTLTRSFLIASSVGVTSRVIIRSLREEVRLLAIPIFERVERRSAFQDGLRKLAVIKADVAQDRLFKVLARTKAVALQDVLDAAVEPLDHAVGLGVHRRRKPVLDAELGAELVEHVSSGSGAFAQAEQPVGEGLSIVGQDPGDLHRCGTFQVAQETARVGRGLRRVDPHEDPSVALSMATKRYLRRSSSAIWGRYFTSTCR